MSWTELSRMTRRLDNLRVVYGRLYGPNMARHTIESRLVKLDREIEQATQRATVDLLQMELRTRVR